MPDDGITSIAACPRLVSLAQAIVSFSSSTCNLYVIWQTIVGLFGNAPPLEPPKSDAPAQPPPSSKPLSVEPEEAQRQLIFHVLRCVETTVWRSVRS